MIKARYQKMYTEKYKQDMDFVIIGDYYMGPFVDMDVAQKAVSAINSQFSPQPKRTRTEYEKVTESIFDLRDEFERVELYCKHEHAREFTQIKNPQTLAQSLHGGFCFRKVEKEIDWREEVSNFVDDKYSYITIHENGAVDALLAVSSNINFLELCRVALRASGEIE